jgi:hypothetical protein
LSGGAWQRDGENERGDERHRTAGHESAC